MKTKLLQMAVLLFLFFDFSGRIFAQSIDVSGAGSTAYNGHYTVYTEFSPYNGKTIFLDVHNYYIAWNLTISGYATGWQITAGSGEIQYYNTADTPLPPTGGWQLAAGANPAPTLSGDGTFPVELTSFVALIKGKNVELQWNTATEVNNYGFEIERKPLPIPPLTGEGIKGWGRVGFVEGAGTTNVPKSYSFVDATASGKNMYRLKQIDRDGKYEYSSVVEATVVEVQSFGLEQNYPNPFNPVTKINYQLPMNNLVTLRVYDAIGREVATLVNEIKEAGTYSATFDGSKLSSGIYFYTLRSGNFTATKKLMVMK